MRPRNSRRSKGHRRLISKASKRSGINETQYVRWISSSADSVEFAVSFKRHHGPPSTTFFPFNFPSWHNLFHALFYFCALAWFTSKLHPAQSTLAVESLKTLDLDIGFMRTFHGSCLVHHVINLFMWDCWKVCSCKVFDLVVKSTWLNALTKSVCFQLFKISVYAEDYFASCST